MASILRREPHKDSATVNWHLSLLSVWELGSILESWFISKPIFTWKQVKKFCPQGGGRATSRGDVEEAVDDVEEEDEEAEKSQKSIRVNGISEKKGVKLLSSLESDAKPNNAVISNYKSKSRQMVKTFVIKHLV